MEISNINNSEYSLKDVVRIIDPKQQKLYIKHMAFPIDMYVSKDIDSDEEKLVMFFNKAETRELYIKWKNHELR
jgi:hypothetical protein